MLQKPSLQIVVPSERVTSPPPGTSNRTRVNGVAELAFDRPVPGTGNVDWLQSAEPIRFCL